MKRYTQIWFIREGFGNSFSATFWVWFFNKSFSHVIFCKLAKFDSDCLYFLRYWAICVLRLFVNQVVTSWVLKLFLSFQSSRFSTWSKSQYKNLDIFRKKDIQGLSFAKNCLRPDSAPLIWRLGTRVSSIFQTLGLKPIFKPCQTSAMEHFSKTVNSWYCHNQKQLSGGVLQKCCSYKCSKIHKKTPALESRF